MTTVYNVKAIVATMIGQIAGLTTRKPYDTLEEATAARDLHQQQWLKYDWIVLYSTEPLAHDGIAEAYIAGKLLKESAVYFIITEDYKLSHE